MYNFIRCLITDRWPGILYKLHFQVAETCQLAVQRIEWLKEKSSKENGQLRLVLHVHIG